LPLRARFVVVIVSVQSVLIWAALEVKKWWVVSIREHGVLGVVFADAAINLLVPCHRQSTLKVLVFLAAAQHGLLVANASRMVEMRRSHLFLFAPGAFVEGKGVQAFDFCCVERTSRDGRRAWTLASSDQAG
jgi:hypothetical protein